MIDENIYIKLGYFLNFYCGKNEVVDMEKKGDDF